MSNNKIITVSTKGEKATFSIKLSGKGHNSLDFFCNSCHSGKPVVSILDSSENYFLFFKRTEDGFELKKKEYPPEEKWTYDGGRYIIEPGAYDDQTELRMHNKIFIFRNDYYQDIKSDGVTVGFFDGKSTRLFIRCYINDGMLMIEFA